MRDILPFGVQELHNSLRIRLVAGRKHNDLKVFAQLSNAFPGIGSQINGYHQHCAIGKHDRQLGISRALFHVVAMNEGFIQIEYNRILFQRRNGLQLPSSYLGRHLQPRFPDLAQKLKRGGQMLKAELLKR